MQAGQVVAQLGGHGPGFAGADLEGAVCVSDFADSGDDGGGAAGEDFFQGAALGVGLPVFKGVSALLDLQGLVAGQINDRGAGDAGQDGAAQRRGDERAVCMTKNTFMPPSSST